jgi:hypothetical protein
MQLPHSLKAPGFNPVFSWFLNVAFNFDLYHYTTANQVRMRFHGSGGAIPMPESFATQLQIKRRFIEHCGYCLHGVGAVQNGCTERLYGTVVQNDCTDRLYRTVFQNGCTAVAFS